MLKLKYENSFGFEPENCLLSKFWNPEISATDKYGHRCCVIWAISYLILTVSYMMWAGR